jgi:hypothetical protein
VEDSGWLGRKENVEIFAWILTVVMGNWCVARGFRPRALGFEVTVTGAAQVEQLD